jgi:hypothetical protein
LIPVVTVALPPAPRFEPPASTAVDVDAQPANTKISKAQAAADLSFPYMAHTVIPSPAKVHSAIRADGTELAGDSAGALRF